MTHRKPPAAFRCARTFQPRKTRHKNYLLPIWDAMWIIRGGTTEPALAVKISTGALSYNVHSYFRRQPETLLGVVRAVRNR